MSRSSFAVASTRTARRAPIGSTRSGAMRGDRVPDGFVPVLRPTPGTVIVGALGRLCLAVALWLARHPLIAAAGVVLGLLRAVLGVIGLLAVLLGLALTLTVVRLCWPTAFTGFVSDPLRSRVRVWWRYHRHWQPVMATAGLTTQYDGREYVPRLDKAVVGSCVDSLRVRLLAGQSPTDYERAVEALAHTLGALSCRVRVDRPGRIWLDLTHADPLDDLVLAPAILPCPTSPRYRSASVRTAPRGCCDCSTTTS